MTPQEMEAEALSLITTGATYKLVPRMTAAEIERQAKKFKAVAWIWAGPQEFHKVGISHNGQLAFSHHTIKDLKRMAAFAALGGQTCECVEWYSTLFVDLVWWGVPPHFRRVLCEAQTRRLQRRPETPIRMTTIKPTHVPVPILRDSVEGVHPTFQVKNTRVLGRRTRYE